MGDSDYRYEYSSATYADEILAVIEHAGLGADTLVVAHSFGGYMAVKAANLHPEKFGGLILVDSGIRHPDEPIPDRPNMGGMQGKIYPDRDSVNAFSFTAASTLRERIYPSIHCTELPDAHGWWLGMEV